MHDLPRWPDKRALGLAAFTWGSLWSIYALAAWWGDRPQKRYRLYWEWECQVPLIPEASLVYMSVGLMLIPLLRAFPSTSALWPLVKTLWGQYLLAALIFVAFPLEDGFLPANPPTSWASRLWGCSNQLALRHNYLPSLHVCLATTIAMAVSRRQGTQIYLYLWAAAVAVSTLLVHQHHLADVLAGGLLAYISMRWGYDRWSEV